MSEQVPQSTPEATAHPERAILVGIEPLTGESRRSMQELLQLVRAAGASPVDVVVQRRDRPDPATFIGRGKLVELAEEVIQRNVDVVVLNAELRPAQVKNLVDGLECKVLDRTELILDIFAQHAHSREGKLQVELAQLGYLLPRLVGRGVMMSRIGGGRRGGIGVRGPGETELEMDRRRLRQRITRLRRELAEVQHRRDTERAARRQSGLATASIVGYTNAGKSALLNALAASEEVSAHDRLFETLDPTVRRIQVAQGAEMLVSDTVGFIRDLPTELIAAFRATLDEVVAADFIIEVVDASDPQAAGQHEVTEETLGTLGALDKPQIMVLNKWDLVADSGQGEVLQARFREALPVSALHGNGLAALQARLAELIQRRRVQVTVQLPYDRLELLEQLHSRGRVLHTEYQSDYVVAQVEVDQDTLGRVQRYVVTDLSI